MELQDKTLVMNDELKNRLYDVGYYWFLKF